MTTFLSILKKLDYFLFQHLVKLIVSHFKMTFSEFLYDFGSGNTCGVAEIVNGHILALKIGLDQFYHMLEYIVSQICQKVPIAVLSKK